MLLGGANPRSIVLENYLTLRLLLFLTPVLNSKEMEIITLCYIINNNIIIISITRMFVTCDTKHQSSNQFRCKLYTFYTSDTLLL